METNTLLLIVGMALVTYASRAGGLWLMGRVKPSPLVERWLEHLPGAILVSIVAPILAAGGPAEWLAALAALVIGRRTGSVLLAMLVGAGVVWVVRGVG